MNTSKYYLVYRGENEDLKRLNLDKKVQIDGWGTNRQIGYEKIFTELNTHSDNELLLQYIQEYVLKTYPSIKITKFVYEIQKEVDI